MEPIKITGNNPFLVSGLPAVSSYETGVSGTMSFGKSSTDNHPAFDSVFKETVSGWDGTPKYTPGEHTLDVCG